MVIVKPPQSQQMNIRMESYNLSKLESPRQSTTSGLPEQLQELGQGGGTARVCMQEKEKWYINSYDKLN